MAPTKKVTYSFVVKETFRDFFISTQISGINNAGRSRYIILCVVWVAISAMAMYRTTIDVIQVLDHYKKFPYTTQIKVDHRSQVPFPAVTFCNQNIIDCTKLFRTMLIYAHNDSKSETFETITKLYTIAQCGKMSMACHVVFQIYVNELFEDGTDLPQSLFEADQCLDCWEVMRDYDAECINLSKDDDPDEYEYSKYFAFLDYIWKSYDCKDDEDMKDYPESLTGFACYRPGGPIPRPPAVAKLVKSPVASVNILDTSEDQNNLQSGLDTNEKGKSIHSSLKGLATTVPTENLADLVGDAPAVDSELNPKVLSTEKNEENRSDLTSAKHMTPIMLRNAENSFSRDPPNLLHLEVTEKVPKETPIADTDPKIPRKKRQVHNQMREGMPDKMPDAILRELLEVEKHYEEEDDMMVEMGISEDFDTKMRFLSLYVNLSTTVKEHLSYTFDEMFKDCVFNGQNCKKTGIFRKSFANTYGNCYTFNDRGTLNTSYTGTSYSLSLVMDVREDTYLPKLLTEKAGARIVIHQPRTSPLLDDDGLDAHPSMASSFAIRERQMTTLPHPYEAKCVRSWANTSYALRGTGARHNLYTTQSCLRMCVQRHLVTGCKCVHPHYPMSFTFNGTFYGHQTVRYCSLTSNKESDKKCVEKMLKDYSENPNKAECGCGIACNTTEYPRVLSVSKWPPNPSTNYAYGKFKAVVTSSLMKIEVFFNSLSKEQIYQSQVYSSYWDLVSNLGGALSLYMGISIFMMLEVIEFLVILCYHSVLYAKGRYKPNAAHVPQRAEMMYPIVTPETLHLIKKAGRVQSVPHGGLGKAGRVESVSHGGLSTQAKISDIDRGQLNSAFEISEKDRGQLNSAFEMTEKDRGQLNTAFDMAFQKDTPEKKNGLADLADL